MAEYTIKIPGLDQIIRLGPKEPEPMPQDQIQTMRNLQYKKELTGEERTAKQEEYYQSLKWQYENEHIPQKEAQERRIQRMKAQPSPIPESMRWIPSVINWIDDAQDLLITAAYLAKPLLKRLPARFIPYVGWGLLASDLLNLGTNILGFGMTPCLTKPEFRRGVSGLRHNIKYPATFFREFIKFGGWRAKLGIFLQGAQAAYTVFGRGLVLGPLMGTFADATWAVIRAAAGQDVTIKYQWPRPSEIIQKAGKFITNTLQHFFAWDILSEEDHFILLAAQKIATDILCESGLQIDDGRANEMLGINMPVFTPWAAPTLEALQSQNVPIDENTRYYLPDTGAPMTYDQAFDLAMNNFEDWGANMRNLNVSYNELAVWYMVFRELAEDNLYCLTGAHPDDYLDYDPYTKAIMQYNEQPIMIHPSYPIQTQEAFMNNAITNAKSEGKEYPNSTHFAKAAKELNLNHGTKSKYCFDPDSICCMSIEVRDLQEAFYYKGATVELYGLAAPTTVLTPYLQEVWGEQGVQEYEKYWADGWGGAAIAFTNMWSVAHIWGAPRGVWRIHINHCLLKPYVYEVDMSMRSWFEAKFNLQRDPTMAPVREVHCSTREDGTLY